MSDPDYGLKDHNYPGSEKLSRKSDDNNNASSLDTGSVVVKKLSNLDIHDEVSRWELKSSEIKLGPKLGKGSYGVVYQGNLRGKEVAVKKLFETNLDETTMETFKKEVAIMSKLRHPNVLLFMGACTEPGNLLIVTEIMPKGSVYDLLHNPKVQLSFSQKIKIAKDAAYGMNWLHLSDPVFIHRDLKTGNLLVDQNWNVKVSDFGLSHIKKHNTGWKGSYGAIGTPLWMAPEVLLNKEYNESADVYGFGIVLWELLTQEEPFPDIDSFETMIQSVCIGGERPPIPNDCPATLAKLIKECWAPNPEDRPTFQQLLNDKIFDKIIVEYTIQDEMGKQLWENHFLGEENVAWLKFLKGFCTFWKLPIPDVKNLPTKYLCFKETTRWEKDENMVNMENFSKMLAWFGPMENPADLLDKIENLLRQPYFHGDMGATEAEKILPNQKRGTFLVRFSARDPGCYAISTLSEGNKVKHFRVYHKPGLKFLIGKTEVDSLQEIVTRYGKDLELQTPCPGWPYEKLFSGTPSKKDVSDGYQMPDFE